MKKLEIEVREIRPEDIKAMRRVIKEVGEELDINKPGYGPYDKEVDDMFSAYQGGRRKYFVALEDGDVLGGSGIAPWGEEDSDTCELRKLFLSKKSRGKGVGYALMKASEDAAKELGYDKCYLETLISMEAACKLYEKNGYQKLDKALEGSDHGACDNWYIKEL